MHTEYGTSYNSYLLKGSEKTALFETAKVSFFDDYLKHIESVCDVKDIDYIIMALNAFEPNVSHCRERISSGRSGRI
jgi:Uncharacterized flavoproteins